MQNIRTIMWKVSKARLDNQWTRRDTPTNISIPFMRWLTDIYNFYNSTKKVLASFNRPLHILFLCCKNLESVSGFLLCCISASLSLCCCRFSRMYVSLWSEIWTASFTLGPDSKYSWKNIHIDSRLSKEQNKFLFIFLTLFSSHNLLSLSFLIYILVNIVQLIT